MVAAFDRFEHAGRKKPTRYVIVGCGYAAVLNHLTLRKSRAGQSRLDKRPILHIGYDDPWLHYRPHLMGQAPHLLELPGYRTGFVRHSDSAKPLRSNVFAAATAQEFAALLRGRGMEPAPLGPRLEGWVALIQSRDRNSRKGLAAVEALGIDVEGLDHYPEDAPKYRLLVVVGGPEAGRVRPRLVYADRIDLCLGSGVPRTLPADRFGEDRNALDAYKRPAWERVESYDTPRFAVPAQHALYGTTRPNGRDTRICIYGSGAIALNLVETRLGRAWLDWMANMVHRPWTSERNNEVFDTTRGGVLPADPKLRLGEWVDIDRVAHGRVTFRPFGLRPEDLRRKGLESEGMCRVLDHLNRDVPLDGERGFPHVQDPELEEAPPPHYDQLLVSMGFLTDITTPGTAHFITQDLHPWRAIVARDGQMVALECADGNVRILGSAAHTFPAVAAPDDRSTEAKKRSVEHYGTLPIQARPWAVGEPEPEPIDAQITSIPFNAASVAFANGLLGEEHPNRNVNTVEAGDLAELLDDDALAEKIVKLRAEGQSGFANVDELVRALGGGVTLNTWRARLAPLRYDYAGIENW